MEATKETLIELLKNYIKDYYSNSEKDVQSLYTTTAYTLNCDVQDRFGTLDNYKSASSATADELNRFVVKFDNDSILKIMQSTLYLKFRIDYIKKIFKKIKNESEINRLETQLKSEFKNIDINFSDMPYFYGIRNHVTDISATISKYNIVYDNIKCEITADEYNDIMQFHFENFGKYVTLRNEYLNNISERRLEANINKFKKYTI